MAEKGGKDRGHSNRKEGKRGAKGKLASQADLARPCSTWAAVVVQTMHIQGLCGMKEVVEARLVSGAWN